MGEAAIAEDRTVDFEGHTVTLRGAPVDSAAVYVPGGRAPYPSTVVMGVVTARVAGVAEVAVCAPPSRDADVDHVVLAACGLAGADTVYRMGGAQAIAALAYGTESVPAVDVIVGPGNLYVQEAKRQVFGQVGIDGFAGPSDLVVIADGEVDPGPIVLDLLAQAEHGPGTLVVAISDSRELLEVLVARHRESRGDGRGRAPRPRGRWRRRTRAGPGAGARAPSADRNPVGDAGRADYARRLSVRGRSGRPRHSATTSRAPTT